MQNSNINSKVVQLYFKGEKKKIDERAIMVIYQMQGKRPNMGPIHYCTFQWVRIFERRSFFLPNLR